MARKVMNRKELRIEGEAAERAAAADPAAKEAKEKAPPKKRPSRSRAKAAAEVRLKAFWGVFNQSLKRVALYEYSQRVDAEKKAKELTASSKTPHFVQPVKEAIS